jgi:hypothetical protein
VEGGERRPKAERPGRSASDRGGFAIEVEEATVLASIVRARLWGFWDMEVARRFRAELLSLGLRLGQGWAVLVDSRAFLPQTPEVTRHRRDTIEMIMKNGCSRIAVIVTENGTYAMQFSRIATEARVANGVFLDSDAALKWIREA